MAYVTVVHVSPMLIIAIDRLYRGVYDLLVQMSHWCWEFDPCGRPSMGEVLSYIVDICDGISVSYGLFDFRGS